MSSKDRAWQMSRFGGNFYMFKYLLDSFCIYDYYTCIDTYIHIHIQYIYIYLHIYILYIYRYILYIHCIYIFSYTYYPIVGWCSVRRFTNPWKRCLLMSIPDTGEKTGQCVVLYPPSHNDLDINRLVTKLWSYGRLSWAACHIITMSTTTSSSSSSWEL